MKWDPGTGLGGGGWWAIGWNEDKPLFALEVNGRGPDDGDDAVELMEFELLLLSARHTGVPVIIPEFGFP